MSPLVLRANEMSTDGQIALFARYRQKLLWIGAETPTAKLIESLMIVGRRSRADLVRYALWWQGELGEQPGSLDVPPWQDELRWVLHNQQAEAQDEPSVTTQLLLGVRRPVDTSCALVLTWQP